MKAAVPPTFCASAITCKARVVLPEDSGPKISTTRPRGKPPTPKALSREIEPLEMIDTGTTAFDPSRRMVPLPNCFSIWTSARSIVRRRSCSFMRGLLFTHTCGGRESGFSGKVIFQGGRHRLGGGIKDQNEARINLGRYIREHLLV